MGANGKYKSDVMCGYDIFGGITAMLIFSTAPGLICVTA